MALSNVSTFVRQYTRVLLKVQAGFSNLSFGFDRLRHASYETILTMCNTI